MKGREREMGKEEKGMEGEKGGFGQKKGRLGKWDWERRKGDG